MIGLGSDKNTRKFYTMCLFVIHSRCCKSMPPMCLQLWERLVYGFCQQIMRQWENFGIGQGQGDIFTRIISLFLLQWASWVTQQRSLHLQISSLAGSMAETRASSRVYPVNQTETRMPWSQNPLVSRQGFLEQGNSIARSMRHQNGERADGELVSPLRSKLSSPFW